jgi:uncharacterized membrane protein (DUF485 family)
MAKSAHEIVSSEKFKKLVSKRWAVSFFLTFLLFVIYYGYIGMIGYAKDVLKIKIGEAINIGIILGVGVIIGSWFLTVLYVFWANNYYDKTIQELKKELK